MNSIEEIIDDIREGKMVVMIDDENRENEGDLILAADFVTPHAINFMAREARGLICLALEAEQIRRLGLPQMVKDDINNSPNKTAFTVSIEASSGVTTGISAADRAHTVRVAANPLASPADIIVPGHVFPIRAQDGGVLKRAGHTEASVDLARLAGLKPAAVICEVMNFDGTMARTEQLKEFALQHNLKIGTIEDLIKYRIENESFIEETNNSNFVNEHGQQFQLHVFKNRLDGREHLAFTKGDLSGANPVLVRVQTENILGDVFGDAKIATQKQISHALDMIHKNARGVLVYLRNEDMSPNADQKTYGVGAQILHALGVKKIQLITNTPSKRVGIKGFGLEIIGTVGHEAPVTSTNNNEMSLNA